MRRAVHVSIRLWAIVALGLLHASCGDPPGGVGAADDGAAGGETSEGATGAAGGGAASGESVFEAPTDPVFPATVSRPVGDEIVVAGYNVRNYLTMDRWVDGKRVSAAPKPEEEIAAMVRVVQDMNPDILMLSEVGTEEDFADLRRRLAAGGIEYPESEYLDAADEHRHLALLSRFPIVARDSDGRLPYTLNGKRMHVQRGILDVTVEINPDYRLRVMGVHFKSKRPVPEGEALMRRNEARILRERIDRVLGQDPEVNLLVTGDFNDTKNEPPMEEVIGKRGSPGYMADIWLEDPLGDRWTHHWRHADLYSRIDYVLVSRALFPEVNKEASYVYRSDYWSEASDHRAVVAIINPRNR